MTGMHQADPATEETSPGHDPAVHQAGNQRFLIRHCETFAELDACVALQQQSWGYPDLEVVPRNMYVLAQALGGHVICAWTERGELAGFAMAIAAHQPAADQQRAGRRGTDRWMQPVHASRAASIKPERSIAPLPYLHSHMLAVAPPYQDSGLGFALKVAQRRAALAQGIEVMRWTFDPLAAKNAHFNLRRLGAVSRRYIPDLYGRVASALQGGLPTDRLLAEWSMNDARVLTAIDRSATVSNHQPVYAAARRIELPAEITAWKRQGAMREAEAAQGRVREEFEAAFASGMAVVDFLRANDGGGEYVLIEPTGED